MLCGCTITSICEAFKSNSHLASITSKPLFINVAESMVIGYLASTYRDALAFAILIVILLFRPAGILGKNVKEKV
jgi:branched-subunit amino acid ABC-type transport system permease component